MLRWDNPQRHWPGRGLFLQQGAIDLFIADSLERTGYACELKLLYFQATILAIPVSLFSAVGQTVPVDFVKI